MSQPFIPAAYGAPDEARAAPVGNFHVVPSRAILPETARAMASRQLDTALTEAVNAVGWMMGVEHDALPETDLDELRAKAERLARAADLFVGWVNCGLPFEDAKATLLELTDAPVARAAFARMTDPNPAPAIATHAMTAREANFILDQADHLGRLKLEKLARSGAHDALTVTRGAL